MAKKTTRYTPDFYARKAKQVGYSARSVYKLEEIHKKYLNKLSQAKKILDLGAAPGSWSQYLQKHISPQGEIIAVDIQEINTHFSDAPQVSLLTADFTNTDIITQLINLGPYDYIVSDAAPLTTGHKSVDTARSELLVESMLHIAEQSLLPHGTIVAKLFQGSNTATLLQELRKRYHKVTCVRPKAVKSASFETYLVCSLR